MSTSRRNAERRKRAFLRASGGWLTLCLERSSWAGRLKEWRPPDRQEGYHRTNYSVTLLLAGRSAMRFRTSGDGAFGVALFTSLDASDRDTGKHRGRVMYGTSWMQGGRGVHRRVHMWRSGRRNACRTTGPAQRAHLRTIQMRPRPAWRNVFAFGLPMRVAGDELRGGLSLPARWWPIAARGGWFREFCRTRR